MTLFKEIPLSDKDYFRAVILYGANVASYKFALAESIIGIAAEGKDFATLTNLALPFSDALCRHLEIQDKQTTSRTSRFLDMLRGFNRGEIDIDEKIDSTVRLGFVNVIDAFHVVHAKEIPIRFFHDERKSPQPGIRLTDELLEMAADIENKDLLKETESRWRLVETAWRYNMPRRLITVDYDKGLESFFVTDSKERRHSVTNARYALNGYQRGKCFYCNRQVHLEDWRLLEQRGEVDHVFPHILQRNGDVGIDLDQAWNLVLACNKCNGSGGKRDHCPDISYVEDLHHRNENLIMSHHPLRESIIVRTGKAPSDRKTFLNDCHAIAKRSLIHSWKTDRL